jgi:hypothetical protein
MVATDRFFRKVPPILKQGRHNRRRIACGLSALIGAWPALAHADAPLPLPAPGMAICDGPDEPGIALPALADLDQALPPPAGRVRNGVQCAPD